MMDNYEVLGVSRNSSMEEIKAAYEEKLKKIDSEVVNEKNAAAFKKVLQDAYDSLTIHNALEHDIKEHSISEDTIVMTKEEFESLANKEEAFDYDNLEEDDYDDDEGYDSYDDYYDDELGYDDGYDDEGYDDYDDGYESRSKRKKRKNKKKKSKDKIREKRRDNTNRRKSDFDEKSKKIEREIRNHESILPWFIKLPISIVLLPLIIIFSVILFIFDIINAVLWAVTKLLIVASIVGGGAYAYLVYQNMIGTDNRIPILCGGVFLGSIILPIIVKSIPKPLEILNNKLKGFVF